MLTPLLTEADPVASSEGTLDPLGLYATADSLGVRLVAGVRERQQHPRFLTAMAVSLAVCSEFDEDAVAEDHISEPWQVFEWYMVEGLVRTCADSDEIRGLPGRDKASAAIRDRVPLSAASYLKAPSVYGFHGVYRLLARTLDVEQGGRLGEVGYDLLNVWADEQCLKGFHGTQDGDGREQRRQLADAVLDGLKPGATARSGAWSGWEFFRKHLLPKRPGKKEARTIISALTDPREGFRHQVIAFLVSDDGQRLWRKLAEEAETRIPDERPFHKALHEEASPELRALLDAIDAYETFARLLQDAFDDCLYEMSQKKGSKVKPSELSRSHGVRVAAERVVELFPQVADLLQPFPGESLRFHESFADLAEKADAEQWVEMLLAHHQKVQRRKPPNGKNSWFERFDDGSTMIRPGYLRDEGGRADGSYVHTYRTQALWSFARDLRMVS